MLSEGTTDDNNGSVRVAEKSLVLTLGKISNQLKVDNKNVDFKSWTMLNQKT